MNDMVSLLQAVIRDQLQGFRTAELGVVTQVYSHVNTSDKNNYECDVRLRDSGLELKKIPTVTQRIGAVAVPNKDDLVMIQFLNGDIHSAFVTARVYNDTDRPPEAKPREFVYISPDKEEKGIRRVYMEFPNGNKFLLDDDKLVLEMGKTKVTINHDGAIELKSNDKKITLKDQNGNNMIEIKPQQGNIKVQGQTKVVVEAPQIDLVENATHPLVFGDNLLQYLNQLVQIFQTHIHPGQMAGPVPVTPAPPVPPFPPATPSLLSLKVKSGRNAKEFKMALTTDRMVSAIEEAFQKEWEKEKNTSLPDIGQEDRRLLFAGIARGILEYLENHQDDIFKSFWLRVPSAHSINYIVDGADLNYSEGS